MEYQVNNNFYHDYSSVDFNDKLNVRIKNIQNTYKIKNNDIDHLLSEYFVEIFSWSVFTKDILYHLEDHITSCNLSGVIDPCCGNAFHTYLLQTELQLNTYSVDIQDEPFAWTEITEMDGRTFLKNLNPIEHQQNALLLSWVDYESLNIELLNLYQGKLVISVGNYYQTTPGFIDKIRQDYHLINTYILKMPWDLTERIEIYLRNEK